jgi:ABC-2 type transport system permease protein
MQRVSTRAFLIGTILTPLTLIAILVLPTTFANIAGGDRQVLVFDQSGDPALFETINKKIAENQRPGTKFDLRQIVVAQDQPIDEVRMQHNAELEKDSDKAYIVLRADVLSGGRPEYYAGNVTDISIASLSQSINEAVTDRALERAGFDAGQVSQLLKEREMKTIKVSGGAEAQAGGQTIWVIFFLFFFTYITLVNYGASVFRGVIEEKQSRILEVMVSSVKPFQMMIGKLVGIGLVGLTQYGIWVVSVLLITILGRGALASRGFSLTAIPIRVVVSFIIYFVLGYFLVATLNAIVGSMVSNEEDAEQLRRPLQLLNFVPLMVVWMVMRDPNSAVSSALSMFPLFGPTLMTLRIAISSPPLWQILLSILLMIVTIVGAIWVAAKIYRVGILIYGKRASLAELGRWLHYA